MNAIPFVVASCRHKTARPQIRHALRLATRTFEVLEKVSEQLDELLALSVARIGRKSPQSVEVSAEPLSRESKTAMTSVTPGVMSSRRECFTGKSLINLSFGDYARHSAQYATKSIKPSIKQRAGR